MQAILVFLAQTAGPAPEVNIKEATDALIAGISAANWVLICAGGGLIVVLALRYVLLPKLTGKALALVSCALIAVAAACIPLIADPTKWLEAIGAGLAAGLAAGKLWDVLPNWLTDILEKSIKAKR